MTQPKEDDKISVLTSRGERLVTRRDLGHAIDSLASRMGDPDDMTLMGPSKDDLFDAQLLLRINPAYEDIGMRRIVEMSEEWYS